jgi:20S proteasome alpha/beta subunit
VTLVLAIRCREGLVLASDGQATTDAAGQPTRQPVRKLFAIGDRIVWGAAGSLGLQQTLAAELDRRAGELLRARDPREALAGIVIPVQQRALRDFVALPGAAPPELACIFCWCDGPAGRPAILSIPRTGSDHQLHGRYSAVGTGDIFAEYAMTSVAHLGTDRLTLEQAKMVSYKAVSDAISVAAAYLGPPIQMAVVTPDGAQEVAREDLDGGLSDSVDAWKVRQRESLGALGPPPAPTLLGVLQTMKESA